MSIDAKELANLPHGKAAKIIRATIDPYWGLSSEKPKPYRVTVERKWVFTTCDEVCVTAPTEEIAGRMAIDSLTGLPEYISSNVELELYDSEAVIIEEI